MPTCQRCGHPFEPYAYTRKKLSKTWCAPCWVIQEQNRKERRALRGSEKRFELNGCTLVRIPDTENTKVLRRCDEWIEGRCPTHLYLSCLYEASRRNWGGWRKEA